MVTQWKSNDTETQMTSHQHLVCKRNYSRAFSFKYQIERKKERENVWTHNLCVNYDFMKMQELLGNGKRKVTHEYCHLVFMDSRVHQWRPLCQLTVDALCFSLLAPKKIPVKWNFQTIHVVSCAYGGCFYKFCGQKFKKKINIRLFFSLRKKIQRWLML